MTVTKGFIRAILVCWLAGCASEPTSVPTTAHSAATQPSDPKASLTLDQIEPRLVLPAPATRPAGDAPLDAIQAYAQARAALVENQRFTAIKRLEAAAKLDPFSYEIAYDLGHAYQSGAGETGLANDRSLATFERAATLRPDSLELQYELGRQRLERNDTAEALERFRLARLTSDYQSPRHADLAALVDFFLARTLRQSGYTTAALEQYELLLKRLEHPAFSSHSNVELLYFAKHPQILHAEIGELQEKTGNYAQALASDEKALAANPDSTELKRRVIRMSLASGKTSLAKSRSAELVAASHGSTESVELLKDIYRAAGDPKGFTDSLRELHRAQPGDRLIFYALLDQLKTGGRAEEAVQYLIAAARDSNSDPDYIRRLFAMYQARGDLESAMRLLVDSLADRPDSLRDIGPLWSELLKPTRHGRLRLAMLQNMKVPAREEPARLFWVSRLAEIWSRDALARSTLQQAAAIKPAFPPVYRWLIAETWSKPDLDENQKAEACGQLANTVEAQGNNALAAELRGRSLFFQDDAAGAAKAFLLAQSLGDRSPDVQFMFARAVNKQGQQSRAEQLLWKLISDWPQFEDAYQELFGVYLQRRSQGQFVNVLKKWLEAIPTSIDARLIEIALDAQNGGPEGIAAARDIVQGLLAEQPENIQVLRGAESFFRQYAKLEDFIVQLEAERLRNPDNREAIETLVTIYAGQKRLPDAMRVLDAARAAVAKDPDLLYFIAHLYERIDQKQVTEQLLEEIIRMDPHHAAACNDLGYTWADEGKHMERAEQLVHIAVDAEPDNQSYLDSMAWVEYKRGKFAEARGFLDRAIGPANRPDPVVLDHLGDVLYRLALPEQAVKQWQRSAQRLGQMPGGREDLKSLREQLQVKLKQVEQGQPANVAPVAEHKE